MFKLYNCEFLYAYPWLYLQKGFRVSCLRSQTHMFLYCIIMNLNIFNYNHHVILDLVSLKFEMISNNETVVFCDLFTNCT